MKSNQRRVFGGWLFLGILGMGFLWATMAVTGLVVGIILAGAVVGWYLWQKRNGQIDIDKIVSAGAEEYDNKYDKYDDSQDKKEFLSEGNGAWIDGDGDEWKNQGE